MAEIGYEWLSGKCLRLDTWDFYNFSVSLQFYSAPIRDEKKLSSPQEKVWGPWYRVTWYAVTIKKKKDLLYIC